MCRGRARAALAGAGWPCGGAAAGEPRLRHRARRPSSLAHVGRALLPRPAAAPARQHGAGSRRKGHGGRDDLDGHSRSDASGDGRRGARENSRAHGYSRDQEKEGEGTQALPPSCGDAGSDEGSRAPIAPLASPSKIRRVKVLFIAAEAAPLIQVGGLADVAGSLPKALIEAGDEVQAVLPGYGAIDWTRWSPKYVASVAVHRGGGDQVAHTFETEIGGVSFWLITGPPIPKDRTVDGAGLGEGGPEVG